MPQPPSQETLQKFGCCDIPQLLKGGEGTCWKCADVVLKPAKERESTNWESKVLLSLPQRGYKVSEPVLSQNDNWIEDGWSAQKFIEGKTPFGSHVKERLVASRALHKDLEGIEKPHHFDQENNPWIIAERAVFGFIEWKIDDRILPCYQRLMSMHQDEERKWQVIHGDLSGNFLVTESLDPAIIDFTPKWSPVSFGEAVMAVDICTWENIPFREIAPSLTQEEINLLPLAACRRLMEIDTQHKIFERSDSEFSRVRAYEQLTVDLENSGTFR